MREDLHHATSLGRSGADGTQPTEEDAAAPGKLQNGCPKNTGQAGTKDVIGEEEPAAMDGLSGTTPTTAAAVAGE